jgi:1,4-dihydroxy-2-naphthoate polyprenyltransferase
VTVQPGSLAAWRMAVRPHTLTVSLAPVLVGIGVAVTAGGFEAAPAGMALLGALLLQIASNFANDVFDFRSGADNADRKGPPRTAQLGLLSERQLFVGLAAVLLAAFLVGTYLVQVGGWPIVVIGLAGMVSAIAYTAGPYPLGYHGLGDLFVFLFFGLAAVTGTTYVQTGTWEPLAFALAIPIGGIAAGVLSVNNIRDIDTDAPAGKRTMAVRLGARGARWWFAAQIFGGFAVVAALILTEALPLHGALVLFALPLSARLANAVARHDDGPTLNRCLGGTAKLQLLFAMLLLPALLLPG